MAGRCAGCGQIGPPRRINQHLLACAQFKLLFRTDRSRALDAESEYARYRAQNTPEHRAERRDERLTVLFAAQDEAIGRQQQRWATPADILED